MKTTRTLIAFFLLISFALTAQSHQIVEPYLGPMPGTLKDKGFDHLPKYLVDLNNDGLEDVGRFVGSENKPFLSFAIH